MRDWKNKFYRTLDLDKDDRALLKWFRKLSKEMQNEPDCNKSVENENE